MKFETLWSTLSLIALFIIAVLIGYLKSVDQANPRQPLEWSYSQWVTTEPSSANGYFRVDLELDSPADKAVLRVSATDTLTTYVNGKKVSDIDSRSMLASGVYDLSGSLKTGRNVLAFEVHKTTFPATVGLRYELTVIDALGHQQQFVSGPDMKAQGLYPQTTTRNEWFDVDYDDAFWPAALVGESQSLVSQVSVTPEFLLALPLPAPYVLESSQHWNVSLSTSFQYSDAASQRVWLAVSSEVPYEAIVNGISLGVFPATENKLYLNSVLPKLTEGDNQIDILVMSNGTSPVVGGGIIFDAPGQITTHFIGDDWKVVGGSANSVLSDIAVNTPVSEVTLATPAFPPTFQYVTPEAFVPPSIAQATPWISAGILVLFMAIVLPFFRLLGISVATQIQRISLANSIAILCLLVAWFVAQDVRFDARQVFSLASLQTVMIVWMLLVISVLTEQYLAGARHQQPPMKAPNSVLQTSLGKGAFIFVSVLVSCVALFLRLQNIEQHALTVDEATIAGFARGVVERGYPYLMVGGMEVELATYELVPYFLAASIKIFGYSDFALRLPAVLFGTFTTLTIIYCGAAWFGRLAGLAAGLLFAISPWAIYWGQNCFHPSQIQFFNLLALIAFYRLLSSDHISLKLAFLSALAFALSYLSWEGSGLVLPIMAFVAIIMRWRNWGWFFQPNLWIAAVLIIFVVAAQGIRRTLLQEPFIMVGFGKSDLATPKLTFTDASYEPWYYINNFFFIESHVGLSLFFLLGLILMFYDKKLSFVMLFVVMAYLSLTNLLGYYNAHYFYFVLPVFLIAVSAVFVKVLMLIFRSVSQAPGLMMRAQGVISIALIAGILFVPASAGVLHLHRLMSNNIDAMRVDYRPDLAGMNGREVSLELNRYWREGDTLITSVPLLTEHYVGLKGQYFVQTITDRKVVYDTVKQGPYYVDKFVGNPVLRTKQELQEVLQQHDRVFFVAAPVNGLNRIIDADTLNFINRNMRVVAESYDSRLYLWER